MVRALRRAVAEEQFGPMTERVTSAFRQPNGRAVDGVVGPGSRAAMIGTLGVWSGLALS